MAKRRRRDKQIGGIHLDPIFQDIIIDLWNKHGIMRNNYQNQISDTPRMLEMLNMMIKGGYITEYNDEMNNEIRLVLSRRGRHVIDVISKIIQKANGLESSRFPELKSHYYGPQNEDRCSNRRLEIELDEKRWDILCAVEQTLLAIRFAKLYYDDDAKRSELDVVEGEQPNLYYQITRTLQILDDSLVNQLLILEKQHILERNKSPRMVFYGLIVSNSMAFVRFMSLIEYIFKQHLIRQPDLRPCTKKAVSKICSKNPLTFGALIQAFENDEYFDSEITSLLRNANIVRNMIVHNNGIAQRDLKITIGDLEINLRKEQDLSFKEFDDIVIMIHLKKAIDEFYTIFVQPSIDRSSPNQ